MRTKDADEVDRLAEEIALKVWRKVRAYMRRQNRELHDLDEDD